MNSNTNTNTNTNDRRYKLFELKNVQAPNFLMTPLELKEYIDFDVKRIYFLSNPINEKLTGSHCHIKEEDELFIMIQGSCTMVLDDGHGLEEVELNGPKSAITIPTLVWHHFKKMSDDALICAVSSTNYDPKRKDYCEVYEDFQKLIKDKEASAND